ncbi:MAG: glycosyltransferase [Anaerolineae bacterium]
MRGLDVALVSRVHMNPYVSLLAQALTRLAPAARFREVQDVALSGAVAGLRRRRVWHFHWPELLYRSPHRGLATLRWVRFCLALALFRAAGGRVVYTVHNLDPHERHHPRLDAWTNRLLAAWADALHVHDRQAQQEVARQWGRGDAAIVPHGNYIGAYPNTCSRTEARERLGLPREALVFLFVGGLRAYKGLEELIEAFLTLRAEEPNAWLVVAGHSHDPSYVAHISEKVAGAAQVRFSPRYVPPEELQFFLGASDFVVLPYRRATTSGAAILALSFGRPVIAPAIGPFPELLGGSGGILYPPQGPGGLVGALRAACHADRQRMAQEALAIAQELGWEKVAAGHLAVYQRIVGERGEGRCDPGV